MSKTKLVAPWNLKVGQKLIQYGFHSNQLESHTILSILKTKGYFTGKSIWRVTTDDQSFPISNFHAKLGNLECQKAEIVVDN